MQTDTVVGIVGAVVLVSVMVGVFAYEYNNTGDDGGDGGGGGDQSTFEQDFPGLSADGDIDGDGTRNADDPDIDGDGAMNQNDTETAVSSDFSGTVAQSTAAPSSTTVTFSVGEGATAITITASYDRPTPLPVQQAPRLNFRLTDPNGAFDYSVQETDADAPAPGTTILIEFGGDVPAGEWTLTISSDSLAAPAVDYEGSTTVRYGA